jgi:phosphatidylglycerophosphate synthase
MGTATAAHSRINDGITAGIEKRVLIWMAERLPAIVSSDHLSALGLAAMAAAGVAFASFRVSPWAAAGAIASLAVNWFGDSLDGTLARVRDQQRPRYGFYVDHVIDLAGTTMLLAGMGCSGLMHPLVAAAVLAAYLLVSAESYLATHASGVFRMSFLGVGPTELRLLVAAGVLRAVFDPSVHLFGIVHVRLFDVGGLVSTLALAIVFVVSATRNGYALYCAEPLPAPAAETRAA